MAKRDSDQANEPQKKEEGEIIIALDHLSKERDNLYSTLEYIYAILMPALTPEEEALAPESGEGKRKPISVITTKIYDEVDALDKMRGKAAEILKRIEL